MITVRKVARKDGFAVFFPRVIFHLVIDEGSALVSPLENCQLSGPKLSGPDPL